MWVHVDPEGSGKTWETNCWPLTMLTMLTMLTSEEWESLRRCVKDALTSLSSPAGSHIKAPVSPCHAMSPRRHVDLQTPFCRSRGIPWAEQLALPAQIGH